MAIRLLVTLLSIINILLGVSANPGHPRSVNVELRAKWSGTPILLEMGELLAKERQDYLWILVNNWIDLEPELVSASEDHCLQLILDQGSSLISGPLASILHLSLLLRFASAKLVLYRQLAQESLARYSAGAWNYSITSGIRTPEIALDSTDAERWAISENPRISTGRCCWIDDGSRILFDESDIVEWIKHANSSKEGPELFEFDHVYPGGDSKGTLVLYGALGTTCFKRLHSILATASKEGIVKYVYRPVLPSGCESTAGICAQLGGGALNLAGYGVELALKNMEYKAIDDTEVRKETKMENARTDDLGEDVRGFIFSKLLERKPHLAGELMTFRDQLLSSDVSDTMSIWELKDLGYQTAQRIIQAAEPLRLMQEINQNFPNLVSSLSRMKLNDTVKEEIVANQRLLPAGRSLFAINGGLVNVETLDIFTILELVRQELSISDQLLKMKVPPKFINQLLQLPEPVDEGLVRIDFRSNYVHYLNNIEQDDMYRRWRSNLNELLMPVFPGQLRYIRKNLYHAVYIFDPASSKGLQITESIMHYYQSSMPMRFGVILLSSRMMRRLEGMDSSMELEDNIESSPFEADAEDLSCLVIQLFLYVKEKLGVQEAFEFLSHAYDVYDGENEGEDDGVDESAFQEAFIDSFKTMTKSAVMEVYSMVKGSHIYKEHAIKSTSFVYQLGLSQMHPCLLMNGIFYGPNQVQSAATVAMNEELQRIQEGVYFGRIDSHTDILDKFLSDEGYKRYNPQIVTTDKEARKYVPIAHLLVENHTVISNLGYLHSPGTQDDVKPVTHWLILDLTQKAGIRFLKQALSYMMSGSSKARLGILSNILNVDGLSETKQFSVRIIHSVLQLPSRRAKVLPFLHEFFAQNTLDTLNLEERTKAVLELADKIGLNSKDLKKMLEEPFQHEHMVENLHEERKLVTQAFALEPGSNAMITNGRVFVQTSGNLFQAEDFALVESVEYIKRIKPLQDVIETVEWGGLEPDEVSSDFLSNVIMVGSSSMASRSRGSDSARFDLLKSEFSGIVQQRENSSIHVDAVIDPLSTTGQKITPLLVLLQEWIQPSMRIVMNPMSSLTDIPLKNFYRYILPSKFDSHTAIKPGPAGRFSNLPSSRTLTMNMDVPEPWLVEPVVAIHDLDNIVLEKLGDEKTLYAVFELEALMITGHCFEESNDPPRGLQLILGSKQKPHMVDTIVMANLGYFQLKAAPGVWTLKLAEGRSSELYTFNGIAEGTNSGSTSKRVIVDDMKGKLVRLTVVKRKGKEDEKLLLSSDESDLPSDNGKEGKGFLKWAKTIIGGGKKQSMDSKDSLSEGKHHVRHGVTINIFSVASGHLYERFLKIMMLSVLKNTRRPVKFWFIKNYLSPQFKDLIPYMAKEYGFEYQLVTYKWPSWLHKQTEKQRIIWAYKILFLDVIFPLSLKKVIFVDADQIIRTDMGELYDMNLKGRPLAYTPFCDNNKEMDGFRFWNQGFWRDHLQGRPYHISALYVVDLVKFRQTAAGDNLRVFYENLSKDPNSLSNLDQDLPNYAQHTVPIFSLPQEWLWCESWCGNATKAKAKTIDLCNNPMTKEPKLQGARRIVEEWPALDEEARQFTVKVQESQIGSEIENETSVQVGDDFPTVVESHDEL